jgi:hypothetical protein
MSRLGSLGNLDSLDRDLPAYLTTKVAEKEVYEMLAIIITRRKK